MNRVRSVDVRFRRHYDIRGGRRSFEQLDEIYNEVRVLCVSQARRENSAGADLAVDEEDRGDATDCLILAVTNK